MKTGRIHQTDMALLICGCRVPVRNTLRPGAKVACPGAGHGYQLPWVQIENPSGRIIRNPKES